MRYSSKRQMTFAGRAVLSDADLLVAATVVEGGMVDEGVVGSLMSTDDTTGSASDGVAVEGLCDSMPAADSGGVIESADRVDGSVESVVSAVSATSFTDTGPVDALETLSPVDAGAEPSSDGTIDSLTAARFVSAGRTGGADVKLDATCGVPIVSSASLSVSVSFFDVVVDTIFDESNTNACSDDADRSPWSSWSFSFAPALSSSTPLSASTSALSSFSSLSATTTSIRASLPSASFALPTSFLRSVNGITRIDSGILVSSERGRPTIEGANVPWRVINWFLVSDDALEGFESRCRE